jgi:nitrous oxidase accessory protein NosD
VKQHARRLALCVVGVLFAHPAAAATLAVCPSGCSYSSIQAAIGAAVAGDTIAIGTGVYAENVIVDKPLTLRRASRGSHPLIVPATSSPNSCAGSLCPSASNIILVQASNVTIDGLTLDGDNPALASGVVAGGADLDARNGIITDHLSGVFNNLTVADSTVRNIYLRGIYASSGGSFTFTGNTVENVQADPASIAIFNFAGSGVMADNFVSDASDAISSNWSRGVQFLRNTVVRSASGVHTDNAGDGSSTADLIEGNTVSRCANGGYGVWVFAPYLSPVVRNNTVRGCAVGLAVFGRGFGVSAVSPSFVGNTLNAQGEDDSIGVLVSTDLLGFGSDDVTASFSNNVISHFGTGIYVEQQCELFGSSCPGATSAAVAFEFNIINANDVGANGLTGTTVAAEQNWWGCSKGPNAPGCDTAIGTVTFTPWLEKPPH